jgi:hypothetical protein
MKLFQGYDFLDFGCSKGDSMKFAQDTFGGRGLGLDFDADKVEIAKRAGFDAVQQDVTQLSPKTMGRVRYVIMSHFLEHLPTINYAKRCIASACSVAREFVLIQQPYFDADGYLFERGLKLYWSDWHGHLNHMTSLQFYNILSVVAPKLGIKRFLIGRRFPLTDSAAPEIHPLASPQDQGTWLPEEHAPKGKCKFDFPVFRDTFAIVLMDDLEPCRPLAQYMEKHGAEVIFDSLNVSDRAVHQTWRSRFAPIWGSRRGVRGGVP